jgi:hypothetical protein
MVWKTRLTSMRPTLYPNPLTEGSYVESASGFIVLPDADILCAQNPLFWPGVCCPRKSRAGLDWSFPMNHPGQTEN